MSTLKCYAIRERYCLRRYVSWYNSDRKKGCCILKGIPYLFQTYGAARAYTAMWGISLKQYQIVRVYIIEEKCEA